MRLKLGQVCIGKRVFQCRYVPFNFSNKRVHWSQKYRWNEAWKEEVCAAVQMNRRGLKLPILNPKVTITFNTIRLMDYDGAYNAAKPLIDSLKLDAAGVIVDDSPKHIQLEVKQKQVSHIKDQFVEIDIQ